MKKLTATLTGLLLASLCLIPFAAQAQQNGRDFLTLPTPQPVEAGKQVEVTEFFYYTCPYCASFDPLLADWIRKQGDRIVFRRVHLDFHGAGPLQRMYYALEAMGVVEQVHARIFQAIHVQRRPVRSEADVRALVASLGVDMARYDAMVRSFAIQGKVARSEQLMMAYRVTGVPTVTVDGRYVTSPALLFESKRFPPNRINQAMLPILDHLVNVSRQRRGLK